jgi:peptidoglycan/LPS O-acetylase OafA/YrhL
MRMSSCSANPTFVRIDPIEGRTPSITHRRPVIGLDLMRGIAALLVFLGHVRASCFVEFGALPPDQKGLLTKLLFGITRTGHEAVMVFFVLSGFLVGGQIIKSVRHGDFDIAAYTLERCTRIFLPLIPACVFTVAISWLIFNQQPNWLQAGLNMIGLNGILTDTLADNAPLWTLAYEIWFYILAGAIGYLFSTRHATLVVFTIMACGIAVFSVLAARYALFWIMGAFLVLLPNHKHSRLLGVLGATIIAVGVLDYQLAAKSDSFINVIYLPIPLAETLIVVGVCLLIACLCDPAVDASLSLLRKPALYLSTISYTLYLFHYPLDSAFERVFPRAEYLSWGALGMFCAKSAVLLLIINALYLAFEGNTGRVRRYLKNRMVVVRKQWTSKKPAPC